MALTKIDDRGLNTPIDLLDSEKIRFGTGNDLEVFHDGSNSYIKEAGTGQLFIQADNLILENAAGANYLVGMSGGEVILYHNDQIKFETTSTGNKWHGWLYCDDSDQIRLGNGADLKLYHDGSHSYIANTTGNLYITDDGYIELSSANGGEKYAAFNKDGAAELYHNNNKKFETTANGIKIYDTSNNQVGECFDGGFNFTSLVWVDNLRLLDSEKIELGSSQDLQIYHDGSNSRIKDNGTGYIILNTDTGVLIKNGADDEGIAYFTPNGAVELMYDNVKRFETYDSGCKVVGNFFADAIYLQDSEKINLGASDDLSLYHDGSNSYIDHSGGGDFYIRTLGSQEVIRLNAAKDIELRVASGNDVAAKFIGDGAVELYHDNAKTFSTSANAGILWGTEGNNATLYFHADDGDDWADYWNITATTAGQLDIQCRNDSGGFQDAITATRDGEVELYYDGVKKFNTINGGCKVSGSVHLDDNNRYYAGSSDDLEIYHDASDSYIKDSGTGSLILVSNAFKVKNAANNEAMIYANENAAVELYYNNSKRFETTSSGVEIYDHLDMDDSHTIRLGTSADFQIYHNGSHSYLAQSGTGSIILNVTSGQGTYIQTDSASYSNLSLNKGHSNADGVDYFQCRDSSNNLKLHILSTGNVQNANNSYGQTSDSKLKENIVDANSQWEDIKAVKVRNFNFKASTGLETHKQIGVIAQEIESVSAGLVTETVDRDPETQVDLGTKTKSVKYSILYMKAIKALQEAMAKIEVLETEVAALKAK